MAFGNNNNTTRVSTLPRSARQAERIIENASRAAEVSDWLENMDLSGPAISKEEMVKRMSNRGTVGFNSRMLGINSFGYDPEDQSAHGAVIAFLQGHKVLHGEGSSEAAETLGRFYGTRVYGKGKYRKTVWGQVEPGSLKVLVYRTGEIRNDMEEPVVVNTQSRVVSPIMKVVITGNWAEPIMVEGIATHHFILTGDTARGGIRNTQPYGDTAVAIGISAMSEVIARLPLDEVTEVASTMGFLSVGENGEGTLLGRISNLKADDKMVYDRQTIIRLFRGFDDQGNFNTAAQYALQLGGRDPHKAGRAFVEEGLYQPEFGSLCELGDVPQAAPGHLWNSSTDNTADEEYES